MLSTDWFRFAGMNIKGTPSMPRAAVEHDLMVARRNASVLVTQEFRWPWYFAAAHKVLGRYKAPWGSSPGFRSGRLRPVSGAQSVKWNTNDWKRLRTHRALLHEGVGGVSESRALRAVLLKDTDTRLRCWFGTTHFVVGGDEQSDSPLRKRIMRIDLLAFDEFIADLKVGGHPIIFQMDANIHRGSWAYTELLAIIEKHGGTIHGDHGVEYLLTFPGKRIDIEVKDDWIIPTSRLRTDHEGRGITARLVAKH